MQFLQAIFPIRANKWSGTSVFTAMSAGVEVSEKNFQEKIMDLEEFEKSIESKLHSAIGIRIKASLKEPKTIARSEGKAKRVWDKRKSN